MFFSALMYQFGAPKQTGKTKLLVVFPKFKTRARTLRDIQTKRDIDNASSRIYFVFGVNSKSKFKEKGYASSLYPDS